MGCTMMRIQSPESTSTAIINGETGMLIGGSCVAQLAPTPCSFHLASPIPILHCVSFTWGVVGPANIVWPFLFRPCHNLGSALKVIPWSSLCRCRPI